MNLLQDFALFKHIHRTLVPANFWIVENERPGCLKLMKFMAKLCCKIDENKQFNCTNCGICPCSESDHRLFLCSFNDYIITTNNISAPYTGCPERNVTLRNVNNFAKCCEIFTKHTSI